MKKIKLFISILLSVLLIFQLTLVASASDSKDVNHEDASFETAHIIVSNALLDDSPRIPDSESRLLPQTDTRANPASIDLSNSQYFPPVNHQFNIGSCVSWASAYYQFGYQVASNYSLNVNNTYNLFSPQWVHNIIVNGTNNPGSYLSRAYDVLKSNGAVRYSKFAPPSDWVDDPTTVYIPWYLNTNDMTEALRYRISDYQFLDFAEISEEDTPITSYNSSCLDNMKTFLAAGLVLTYTTDFGVSNGVTNTDWICETLSNQTNSDFNGDYVCIRASNITSGRQGHAMAIVGYNDNIRYDLNGNGTIESFEKGAFKVVNSHGTGWRNEGFVWVMYDALNKVSNASNQNLSNRQAIFENYGYYAINVKEYPRDVIAKVTLTNSDRRQVKLDLGVSETSVNNPTTTMPTMLLRSLSAEPVNFSGTGTNSQTATFVFDFGDLYALDTERSNCYIKISDASLSGTTTINEVKLIDGTGKTVALESTDITLNGTTKTYKFKLGIVGDVNNDASITSSDATLIQKYVASLATLSNDDLKVADVNGDGKVTTSDATAIQKYIAHIITEFDNGSVILLG